MATGGARNIETVRSDSRSISRSVSEGNMKGQPSSKIPKKQTKLGGSGGGWGSKK